MVAKIYRKCGDIDTKEMLFLPYLRYNQSMRETLLHYSFDDSSSSLSASGAWTLDEVERLRALLEGYDKKLRTHSPETLYLDLSQVTRFDTAGLILLRDYIRDWQQRGITVELLGMSEKMRKLYVLIADAPQAKIVLRYENFLAEIGKATLRTLQDAYAYVQFLGELTVHLLRLLLKPWHLRLKESVYHMKQAGIGALPVIALTAFLTGMVIAYQGAVQLAKFGADIFIVDIVGISIVREMGPMLTAIVIAGRSGSSYTAEIGAMKLTEEISAMRTMGFDPFRFLVIPRIVALIVVLPLLIFFADMVGILGGMMAAKWELGISWHLFVQRLYEVLALKHYLLGLLKGPFFAFIIATVGAFRGFLVEEKTESIGLQTTASVVNAIFLVIALDALFSVIYTEWGL